MQISEKTKILQGKDCESKKIEYNKVTQTKYIALFFCV